MMHKAWCSIEEVPYYLSRPSIEFQGHTGQKKSLILTRIEHFRTVTRVWFHQWILNHAQSLMYYWIGAILFREVIHQISRPYKLKKNQRLESNLSKTSRPVAAIKSLRFALFTPRASPYLQCIYSKLTSIKYLGALANGVIKHEPFWNVTPVHHTSLILKSVV